MPIDSKEAWLTSFQNNELLESLYCFCVLYDSGHELPSSLWTELWHQSQISWAPFQIVLLSNCVTLTSFRLM